MKRSTCLSAFLVAFSLTSMAFAAPTTTPDGKDGTTDKAAEASTRHGKLVAQNDATSRAQTSDDSSASGTQAGTAAQPAAAGSNAPGGAPSAQPAISVGSGGTTTTAQVKDQPQGAAQEPEKKPPPRRFAGTQIFILNSVSTSTVFRGQRQYDDPTVGAAAYISPRYLVSDSFQLRGRLIVSYEYTNSDTTTYRNEPQLSDTSFQLYYRDIPAFGGFKALVGPYLALPTSKVSRARTMVFNPGVAAQISRSVEDVLGGELWGLAFGYYSHPIYQSNTQEVTDPAPYQMPCAGGTNCGDIVSGSMNSSDAFLYAAIIGGTWGNWSPAIEYLGSYQWAYHPKDVTEAQITPGGSNSLVQSATTNPTALRQSHYFSAWLDYNWNPWLTTELGYYQRVNVLADDGKYANPVFSRWAGDQSVYLGVNINIDNVMKELEGGDANKGIVRAQNSHKPRFNF